MGGKVVTELGTKVDPDRDQVLLDGEPVCLSRGNLYLMLNKPPGFLTTLSDPYGRPTIKDLLKGVDRRVFPVGRLDRDSQGLLILTDDGELSYRLLHPRFKVPKTYMVTVTGRPSQRAVEALQRGIEIAPGQKTQPCKVRLIGRKKRQSIFQMVLSEGRKRQIRYMFRAIGHRVERLVRTEMGPVKLGDLKPGEIRRLSPDEVTALKEAAGLVGDQE